MTFHQCKISKPSLILSLLSDKYWFNFVLLSTLSSLYKCLIKVEIKLRSSCSPNSFSLSCEDYSKSHFIIKVKKSMLIIQFPQNINHPNWHVFSNIFIILLIKNKIAQTSTCIMCQEQLQHITTNCFFQGSPNIYHT